MRHELHEFNTNSEGNFYPTQSDTTRQPLIVWCPCFSMSEPRRFADNLKKNISKTPAKRRTTPQNAAKWCKTPQKPPRRGCPGRACHSVRAASRFSATPHSKFRTPHSNLRRKPTERIRIPIILGYWKLGFPWALVIGPLAQPSLITAICQRTTQQKCRSPEKHPGSPSLPRNLSGLLLSTTPHSAFRTLPCGPQPLHCSPSRTSALTDRTTSKPANPKTQIYFLPFFLFLWNSDVTCQPANAFRIFSYSALRIPHSKDRSPAPKARPHPSLGRRPRKHIPNTSRTVSPAHHPAPSPS